MARMQLTDLPFDLLKLIMIFVAQSSEGAKDLASAISVCSLFTELGEVKDVLRAANFKNVKLGDRYELFQPINGLLSRSAQAGSKSAKYFLAKTLLTSFSQFLVRQLPNATALDQASENQPNPNNFFPGNFHHTELVRYYVYKCSPGDHFEMRRHLVNYLMHLIPHGAIETGLISNLNLMFIVSALFKALREKLETNGNSHIGRRSLIEFAAKYGIVPIDDMFVFIRDTPNPNTMQFIRILVIEVPNHPLLFNINVVKYICFHLGIAFQRYREAAISGFNKCFPQMGVVNGMSA